MTSIWEERVKEVAARKERDTARKARAAAQKARAAAWYMDLHNAPHATHRNVTLQNTDETVFKNAGLENTGTESLPATPPKRSPANNNAGKNRGVQDEAENDDVREVREVRKEEPAIVEMRQMNGRFLPAAGHLLVGLLLVAWGVILSQC